MPEVKYSHGINKVNIQIHGMSLYIYIYLKVMLTLLKYVFLKNEQ